MKLFSNLKYIYALFFSVFLIFTSCGVQSENKENLIPVNEGESEGINWRILIGDSEYYYTDRIPVFLEFEGLPGTGLAEIKKNLVPGAVWGDFRLYGSSQIGLNRFRLILQPLKSGPSVFRTPGSFRFSAEFEIKIKSRLHMDDDSNNQQDGVSTEPMPLILQEERAVPLLIIAAVLLILISVTVFLFFLKLKKRQKGEAEPWEDTLDVLLNEAPSESEMKLDEQRCLEFYRSAYSLLLKDLVTKHGAVKISDSPLELLAHLESPSALNQWALRSLYPMLEDWERCFFSPPSNISVSEKYELNLGILKSWLEFQSIENKESGG